MHPEAEPRPADTVREAGANPAGTGHMAKRLAVDADGRAADQEPTAILHDHDDAESPCLLRPVLTSFTFAMRIP